MATRFRLDIEGLRAVAVLLVVANHAWYWPTGGYIGVDIFFVISGYLITRALLHEKEKTGRIALGRFYTRRFARLAPAAIVTIAVTAGVSGLLFFGLTNAAWNRQAAASLVWVQNWFLVSIGNNYLESTGSASPYQHFWSLSVEEQFYAFWPWLLLLGWSGVAALSKGRSPHLRATVLWIGIAGFAIFLAYSVWFTAYRPASAYYATPTRVWEFAVGVIVATGVLSVSRRRSAVALRTAGLLAIVVAAVAFDSATPFPGATALLPVLGTAAVIVAAERAASERDFGRVLTVWPVRYIGRISYSLYLWHAPIIFFAAALIPGEPFFRGLVCVFVSLIVAAASYRFIEDPARHARVWNHVQDWLSRRRTWTRVGGIAVTAGLVAVLSAGQLNGMSLLPRVQPASVASTTWSSSGALAAALSKAAAATSWQPFEHMLSAPLAHVNHRGCQREPVGLAPDSNALNLICLPPESDTKRTAIVVGDSIAMAWVPAIQGALGSGWQVGALGLAGCPAASALTKEIRGLKTFVDDCAKARRADLAKAAAAKPDLIVLSSAVASMRFLVSGNTGDAAGAEWRQATVRSIESVRSAGVPVLVLGNPPEGRRPVDCAIRIFGPERCTATIPADNGIKRSAEQGAVRDAVVDGMTVAYVDPVPWFCTTDGLCPVGAGNLIIRIDTSHMTAEYSASLANVLRSAFDETGVVPDRAAR
ncbi:acyltransferase [Leifsonia shinshuensis]|uniref:acyltransferase family protein n=1 Tax=Leifsonia shinshuensis TaxID=150026 RepID=UPI001F512CA6|nr:acyltransferase family protein [Leifsonia shinshuensis]MCI0158565.1 acyltransferase [Leifsonia shinshuensis]